MLRAVRSVWYPAILAAGIGVLSGCETQTAGPERPPDLERASAELVQAKAARDGTNADLRVMEALLLRHLPEPSRQLGVCHTLIRVRGSAPNARFRQGRVVLEFPQGILDAAGGRVVRYRYWRSGQDRSHTTVTRFADCLVPDSPQAIDLAWARFSRTAEGDGPAGAVGVEARSGPSMGVLRFLLALVGPRELFAQGCSDEDPWEVPACEIDGVDVVICQATEEYDPELDECIEVDGDPDPEPDPEPDPDPDPDCDPAFEECGPGGGGTGGTDPDGDPCGDDGECEVPPIHLLITLSPEVVTPGGQTTVTVEVLPEDATGYTVTLSMNEIQNSGGHQHIGRPAGQFGTTEFAAPASGYGTFETTYTASLFGGEERISASTAELGAQATLEVAVTGLFPLQPGANYDNTWGSITPHLDSHYGTSATNNALINIAAAYAAEYPGSILRYNDMSLVNGGWFDISGTWTGAHAEHRFGTNCDVSPTNVSPDRYARLEQIFIENGAGFLGLDHAPSSPHWHLRF